MPERHADWLRQSKRDLAHARHAAEDGDYEWSCFAAQQSAEKALNSILLVARQLCLRINLRLIYRRNCVDLSAIGEVEYVK